MKRTLVIAAMIMATLAGCNEDKVPAGHVKQCGFDAATNDTKCIYVPINQVQQQAQQYAPVQQAAPQVVQAAPAAAPVIVNNTGGHSGAGDAMMGMATGMMLGNALSNSGSRVDDSFARQEAERRARLAERRADRADMRAELANHKAALANQPVAQAAPIAPVAPVVPPAPVAPVKSQTLTLPAVKPNYAPSQVVTPVITKPTTPAPMQVSTPAPSKSFTMSSPSVTSSNGFKRK